MSDSLPPMDCSTKLLCPSPTPGACSNSCRLSWWYHPTISSSVVSSPCLQSFPASGSFPISQFLASGSPSIGASSSSSVLLMNFFFLLLYFIFNSFFFLFLKILLFFYCSGFCHTLKWNSHRFTCVPHHDPPFHLPLHPIPLGPPSHQVWVPVSCIQPGLVICFTPDNIHVSMLFSRNIPPSPSPTESKRLFYTSVSLFLFCL